MAPEPCKIIFCFLYFDLPAADAMYMVEFLYITPTVLYERERRNKCIQHAESNILEVLLRRRLSLI